MPNLKITITGKVSCSTEDIDDVKDTINDVLYDETDLEDIEITTEEVKE